MKNKQIRLEDLKREVPFKVPEGYFEELPSIIQARIPEKSQESPLISWSWQRSVALAGALSLFIALIWITYPQQQGPIGQDTLSQVSDEAILEYLESEDISYYDLSENGVVQKAFGTDSTVIHYLDGLDDATLMNQLDDALLLEESIL
ncbi:hypothetical protein [Arundinibacter roseus]|uniref:Uncharacterized protein n=1 Tax=Arundinibacter roseus TaxID=2070510 RepID=A0A4R4K9U0_9BACT|nr:hypothetical protein [Arundinibacter roseus]TDB64617.1 hypothetical protein EZE20_13175 [Arundinibacter roseus]